MATRPNASSPPAPGRLARASGQRIVNPHVLAGEAALNTNRMSLAADESTLRQLGRDASFQVGNLPAVGAATLGLLGRRNANAGPRILLLLAVEPLFWHVVEVGVQLIEVALREGVVLVVVALGAGQRHAQPHRGGGRRRDRRILGRYSSGSAPPSKLTITLRLNPVAIFCVERGVGQQVAGDLLDGESIEGHIAVEGVDDPIAIAPHVAMVVDVVAVGVGVAGQVEPVRAPCARRSGAKPAADRRAVS